MLEVLRISNYAIIVELEVEFSPRLTVITGETGAGKSILLGALRTLLGGRSTAEMVRGGASRAGIEGIFTNVSAAVQEWLVENGYGSDDPDEDADTVILRRDLLAAGSSRNFINGRSATVSQLRDLGLLLVDMHGQNEHSRLYAPAAQLQLLDNYGDYNSDLQKYGAAYDAWRAARDRFETLSTDQGDAQRRKDFLEFQVQEIQGANLVLGEDAELESERKRLINAERLRELCVGVRDRLYEGEEAGNPAAALVSSAGRMLAELGALDPAMAGLADEAEAIRFALEDLSEKVRDYEDKVVGDPQRLDVVESRLEVIRALKRKYGGSLEEILVTGGKLAAELHDIVNHDEALSTAQAELQQAEAVALAAGKKLSAARQKAALEFQKQVERAMRDLELPKAVLRVQLTDAGGFLATGMDTCEILVSLNAGEGPKPMRKVASGGEVSRIMLAIKSVLARRDQVPTLVFDEIDTGISGEAAARVGERLEKLSTSHQVMCITHLPQVAARGELHLVVEKGSEQDSANGGERTITRVRRAEGDERALALARMLSGAKVDAESKRFAEKLLKKS